MKSCSESKETPKMETKHSSSFLKRALAMKKGAKAPKSSPKGKM
jgi:hypothetical protein